VLSLSRVVEAVKDSMNKRQSLKESLKASFNARASAMSHHGRLKPS
jgi:hypothetical protein